MDWLDLLAVQGTLRSSVIWELLHLCPSTRWQHIPELGPSGTGCAFTQSPTSLQGSVLELGGWNWTWMNLLVHFPTLCVGAYLNYPKKM